ncbi:MAG: peptidoglycan-binding protein [Sphingomonadales bacterium]|nr:peptidoglycan-binding protein [Sphingomonadales bacterium]
MHRPWCLSLLLLSGCATLSPDQTDLATGGRPVMPVVTEHSLSLRCLGQLIDAGGFAPVTVYVDSIRDDTVPRFFREQRLSKGGDWLMRTAISKMETPRVATSLYDPEDPAARADLLVISGAWTQDDRGVVKSEGGFRAAIGRFIASAGAERKLDMIAGDFASSVGGRITFASAVGLVLRSGEAEARLFVENGDDNAEVDIEHRWADGPQMAQRRIVEAAALVHIARYYDIDFRPCLEKGWGDPVRFKDALGEFRDLSDAERNRRMQSALNALGYDAGADDGIWGWRSQRALLAYAVDQGLPPLAEPSAVFYAFLVLGKPGPAETAEAPPPSVEWTGKRVNGEATDDEPTDEEVEAANGTP